MNEKLREVFQDKVVNKSHAINTSVDEFSRYVLEYLKRGNAGSKATYQLRVSPRLVNFPLCE